MPKVLIDIPDRTYKDVVTNNGFSGAVLANIIKNGTPLPEDFSLENYERYKKDSENLSWIKCPERMGN